MKFLADILALLGGSSAKAGTQGCYWWFLDEPKAPKSIIER
ncbi:MAG: cyclic lactone autoinducer peptide [Bacilli bacterium]|nr:cyclic lactone autoinducer peptide [Bacilli bacterium]